MSWRRLITKVQRHQSEFGKAKHLFTRNYSSPTPSKVQDCTRNRLFFSQQRLRSSNLGNLYLSEAKEASHLRKLSHQDGPEAAIRAFESQPSLHTNSVAVSEYVKALVQVDGLDDSELLKSLHKDYCNSLRKEESIIIGDKGWFLIKLVARFLYVGAIIAYKVNADKGITVVKADNVDVKIIARRTPGLFGADLANLANVAALKASMDGAKADLDYARNKIKLVYKIKLVGGYLSENTNLIDFFSLVS